MSGPNVLSKLSISIAISSQPSTMFMVPSISNISTLKQVTTPNPIIPSYPCQPLAVVDPQALIPKCASDGICGTVMVASIAKFCTPVGRVNGGIAEGP